MYRTLWLLYLCYHYTYNSQRCPLPKEGNWSFLACYTLSFSTCTCNLLCLCLFALLPPWGCAARLPNIPISFCCWRVKLFLRTCKGTYLRLTNKRITKCKYEENFPSFLHFIQPETTTPHYIYYLICESLFWALMPCTVSSANFNITHFTVVDRGGSEHQT